MAGEQAPDSARKETDTGARRFIPQPVRERIRLNEEEWAKLKRRAPVAGVAVAIAVIVVMASGPQFARTFILGLGAAALSLVAAGFVVKSFGEIVVRTAKPGAARVAQLPHRPTEHPGSGMQLKGVDLRNAHVLDARLPASDLVGARLDGSNFSYACLDGAKLSGISLVDAVLHKASLQFADLRDADLRRADLTEAKLGGADLSNARLEGARLRGAVLDSANLVKADLRRADVERADFANAMLKETDLRGVLLQKSQLTAEQVAGAFTDEQPVSPSQ